MAGLGSIFSVILYLIPIIVLYFVIKVAVKNAIRELKNEDMI